MPPGNPQGYAELLDILEGGQPADDGAGLGVGGILSGGAFAGGVAYGGRRLARRFAPDGVRAAARGLTSRIAGQRAAGQAGAMLSDIAGTAPTAGGAGRTARAATAARSAASRALPWGRTAASAASEALPGAAAGAGQLAGAAAVGGLLGTAAGQYGYNHFAPVRGAASAVNGVRGIGGSGDDVLANGEARGVLGNVGRAFSLLPGGPSSEIPQTIQQQTGVYAPADTNQDGFTSQEEFDVAMATGLPDQMAVSRAAEDRALNDALTGEDAQADDLGRVLDMLEGRAVGVEQDYQDRVGELRSLYETSETPEERAQLQYALGTIEAQRAAGHEVIQNAYGQAMSDNAARADGIRDTAGRQAADVAAIYDDAAGDVRGIVSDAQGQYADSGLGVGATDVSGNVTDWVPQIEAEGARSAALAGQLGNIAADDVAFLASALGGERGAQQGDLERLALGYSADAQMAHNAQVQDRVASERMRLADQTAQAQRFYDSRRYDIDDTGLQLSLDLLAQDRAAAGADGQPIIPTDPQGAYIAGLDMLAQYGQSALPFIANNGLIPPDDLAVILQSMGAAAPAG